MKCNMCGKEYEEHDLHVDGECGPCSRRMIEGWMKGEYNYETINGGDDIDNNDDSN